MIKNKQLPIFFLATLTFASACSTNEHTVDFNDTNREIASVDHSIQFPQAATFDLKSNLGKTYVSFMKTKIKPILDKLGDTANGGGGGFENIGAEAYLSQAVNLDARTLAEYKGAKWNRTSKKYEGGLRDDQITSVYNSLKKIKPHSTVDSISYFSRDDKAWASQNDMALALKDAHISSAPFDLATLYALTGGIGVKVKINDNNYNYHVLYKTGKTKPNEEVMSGRSFASSVVHNASDASDPEYLRDLHKFISTTPDLKPFYKAMILTLASSDSSTWSQVSDVGQSVLSDFLTVYTAESDRHLMVNLQAGNHPWEIDLAAVTCVSAVSAKIGKIVSNGVLIDGDSGGWFAPSPNNTADGPQRSGIGITRKDRQKFQRAIHAFEMTTPDGKELIAQIQALTGNSTYNKNDVIQGVFDFLSSKYTPDSIGANAAKLADLMARFIEAASNDANEIVKFVPSA